MDQSDSTSTSSFLNLLLWFWTVGPHAVFVSNYSFQPFYFASCNSVFPALNKASSSCWTNVALSFYSASSNLSKSLKNPILDNSSCTVEPFSPCEFLRLFFWFIGSWAFTVKNWKEDYYPCWNELAPDITSPWNCPNKLNPCSI